MEKAIKKVLEKVESDIINKLSKRYKMKEGNKKGVRGRPAKEIKPEESYVGEELINRLIERAKENNKNK
jgi:hypothetical protein